MKTTFKMMIKCLFLLMFFCMTPFFDSCKNLLPENLQITSLLFHRNVFEKMCIRDSGTGARSQSDVQTCPTCHGSGYVVTQQRTPLGVMQSQSVCPDCGGTGKKILHACDHCHGRGYEHKRVELDIKIPAGVQSGQQLRVSGKGERGSNGGPNGDVYKRQ